jgi:hypothetical protein
MCESAILSLTPVWRLPAVTSRPRCRRYRRYAVAGVRIHCTHIHILPGGGGGGAPPTAQIYVYKYDSSRARGQYSVQPYTLHSALPVPGPI